MNEPKMDRLEVKLDRAETALNYRFSNRELLREALTHSSLKDDWNPSNERLEFLGDSILGMIISEYLFATLPDATEGELTRIKSSVVSRPTLTKLAKQFELNRCLRVGKGVQKQVSLPTSVISDAVEALIAAIYLDSGIEQARAFILENFGPIADSAILHRNQKNYKSLLQQHVQKLRNITPTYELVDTQGPDHLREFTIRAVIEERSFPKASGDTKKSAEQCAAKLAYRILRDEERKRLSQDPDDQDAS